MGNLTNFLHAYNEERKRGIEKLFQIINQDQVLLKEEDLDIFHTFVKIQSHDKKVIKKLYELEKQGFIGGIKSVKPEGFLSFSSWDLDKINNMAKDYMSMHTLLSLLIKPEFQLEKFKFLCGDIEKNARPIQDETKEIEYELRKDLSKFLRENELAFNALSAIVLTMNEIASEKTEGSRNKTFYQIELQNNKFDPVLFKEYITLEQLRNERNNLPGKNKYLFSLVNFLLDHCEEISLNEEKTSVLLKLVLVLAAQHSLDAVFNVVLTLILKYWEKDKLYKANVIWVKNQLLNSSINLDSLLKLCDSKEGPLYKLLKQLSTYEVKNISADKLFLCVPEDKARELYDRAVFGAITAFNPATLYKISTLVILRLGIPFDGMTVIYRSQDNDGFNTVSEPFSKEKSYGLLSMEKLASLKELEPDRSISVAETISTLSINVSGNNKKRKQQRIFKKNKRQKSEEAHYDADSQNPFASLPDETLINVFRFFKLSERFKLGLVCKRFYAVSRDRKVEEAKYKQYKIVQLPNNPLSAKELEEATLKLQKAVEDTMKELNSLPHWYGDINKEQAEEILNQFPNKSYLLRNAEDIDGALALSYKEVVESTATSVPVKASSSSLEPVLKMEGALILPKEKKDISLPENRMELSSANFKHGLIRMIEGYDGKFYFMFGCFHSMKGYSSLSEIIKYYERMALIPARIEDFSSNKTLKI